MLIPRYSLSLYTFYVQEHAPMIGPLLKITVSVLHERHMNGKVVVSVVSIALLLENCVQTLVLLWQQKKKLMHGWKQEVIALEWYMAWPQQWRGMSIGLLRNLETLVGPWLDLIQDAAKTQTIFLSAQGQLFQVNRYVMHIKRLRYI